MSKNELRSTQPDGRVAPDARADRERRFAAGERICIDCGLATDHTFGGLCIDCDAKEDETP